MAFGIINQTNVTIEQIQSIANFTQPHEFLINVNNTVYDGWLYFIVLILVWVISFIVLQGRRDQILNNAMYGGAICTILSFILRAIFVIEAGVYRGLLTDKQMWIFPVVTILLAGVIWMLKKSQ